MVAAALAAGTAVSAATSMMSSDKASSQQMRATGQATDVQRQMFNDAMDYSKSVYGDTRGDLANNRLLGDQATEALRYLTGVGGVMTPGGSEAALNSPLLRNTMPTEADLEASPMFQFNLTQGLKAASNSASARGLGVSGAAMKGAENFASGLAKGTYLDFANLSQQVQQNQFNRLLQLAGVGQTASLGGGQIGASTAGSIMNNATATGANIGNNLVQGGNAQAAATMAAGNAIGSSANSAAQGYMISNLLQQNKGAAGAGNDGMYTRTA